MGEFWRLVGATILGALISFGTTFFFERRKEERAERAEEQARERQLRQAVRLVWGELLDSSVMVDTAIEYKEWWSNPPHDVTQRLWIANQATLAALIDDEEIWATLGMTYFWVTNFNVWLSMARDGRESFSDRKQVVREPISDLTITATWEKELNSLAEEIRYAMEALKPIVNAEASS